MDIDAEREASRTDSDEENVDLGGGGSTKLRNTGEGKGGIGRKGIGFKSVFMVSEEPHILSDHFSFKFDTRTHGVYGYVVPCWVDPAPLRAVIMAETGRAPPTAGTCLYLPYKEDTGTGGAAASVKVELHAAMLLFLNKLRRIVVVEATAGTQRTVSVASLAAVPTPPPAILANEKLEVQELHDETVVTEAGTPGRVLERRVSCYLVHRAVLQAPAHICAERGGAAEGCGEGCTTAGRSAAQSTEIVLAFPELNGARDAGEAAGGAGAAQGESRAAMQQVFAYLPVGPVGFRFIVQADFDLVSSRQAVRADSAWNRWLRDSIGLVFGEAVRASPYLLDSLGGYLPTLSEVATPFWQAAAQGVLQELKEARCVRSEEGDWCAPRGLLLRPRELPGALVTSVELCGVHKGLHFADPAHVAALGEATVLDLGCRPFTTQHMLELLADTGLASQLPQRPSTWFALLFRYLQLQLRPKDVPAMRALPIFRCRGLPDPSPVQRPPIHGRRGSAPVEAHPQTLTEGPPRMCRLADGPIFSELPAALVGAWECGEVVRVMLPGDIPALHAVPEALSFLRDAEVGIADVAALGRCIVAQHWRGRFTCVSQVWAGLAFMKHHIEGVARALRGSSGGDGSRGAAPLGELEAALGEDGGSGDGVGSCSDASGVVGKQCAPTGCREDPLLAPGMRLLRAALLVPTAGADLVPLSEVHLCSFLGVQCGRCYPCSPPAAERGGGGGQAAVGQARPVPLEVHAEDCTPGLRLSVEPRRCTPRRKGDAERGAGSNRMFRMATVLQCVGGSPSAPGPQRAGGSSAALGDGWGTGEGCRPWQSARASTGVSRGHVQYSAEVLASTVSSVCIGYAAEDYDPERMGCDGRSFYLDGTGAVVGTAPPARGLRLSAGGFAVGDVVTCAVDADLGLAYVAVNGELRSVEDSTGAALSGSFHHLLSQLPEELVTAAIPLPEGLLGALLVPAVKMQDGGVALLFWHSVAWSLDVAGFVPLGQAVDCGGDTGTGGPVWDAPADAGKGMGGFSKVGCAEALMSGEELAWEALLLELGAQPHFTVCRHRHYWNGLPSARSGECTVCMQPLSAAAAAVLPCDHAFHHCCIEQWLGMQLCCPNCRRRASCAQLQPFTEPFNEGPALEAALVSILDTLSALPVSTPAAASRPPALPCLQRALVRYLDDPFAGTMLRSVLVPTSRGLHPIGSTFDRDVWVRHAGTGALPCLLRPQLSPGSHAARWLLGQLGVSVRVDAAGILKCLARLGEEVTRLRDQRERHGAARGAREAPGAEVAVPSSEKHEEEVVEEEVDSVAETLPGSLASDAVVGSPEALAAERLQIDVFAGLYGLLERECLQAEVDGGEGEVNDRADTTAHAALKQEAAGSVCKLIRQAFADQALIYTGGISGGHDSGGCNGGEAGGMMVRSGEVAWEGGLATFLTGRVAISLRSVYPSMRSLFVEVCGVETGQESLSVAALNALAANPCGLLKAHCEGRPLHDVVGELYDELECRLPPITDPSSYILSPSSLHAVTAADIPILAYDHRSHSTVLVPKSDHTPVLLSDESSKAFHLFQNDVRVAYPPLGVVCPHPRLRRMFLEAGRLAMMESLVAASEDSKMLDPIEEAADLTAWAGSFLSHVRMRHAPGDGASSPGGSPGATPPLSPEPAGAAEDVKSSLSSPTTTLRWLKQRQQRGLEALRVMQCVLRVTVASRVVRPYALQLGARQVTREEEMRYTVEDAGRHICLSHHMAWSHTGDTMIERLAQALAEVVAPVLRSFEPGESKEDKQGRLFADALQHLASERAAAQITVPDPEEIGQPLPGDPVESEHDGQATETDILGLELPDSSPSSGVSLDMPGSEMPSLAPWPPKLRLPPLESASSSLPTPLPSILPALQHTSRPSTPASGSDAPIAPVPRSSAVKAYGDAVRQLRAAEFAKQPFFPSASIMELLQQVAFYQPVVNGWLRLSTGTTRGPAAHRGLPVASHCPWPHDGPGRNPEGNLAQQLAEAYVFAFLQRQLPDFGPENWCTSSGDLFFASGDTVAAAAREGAAGDSTGGYSGSEGMDIESDGLRPIGRQSGGRFCMKVYDGSAVLHDRPAWCVIVVKVDEEAEDGAFVVSASESEFARMCEETPAIVEGLLRGASGESLGGEQSLTTALLPVHLIWVHVKKPLSCPSISMVTHSPGKRFGAQITLTPCTFRAVWTSSRSS
ncbi:hypothetical protein CYMTET_36813 [Cymbomonas tetramitiformis]|uniref:RING-type domain-containing protein n=1 Tax=Cymbomonas tetramitiformis TaxID=36881 RepID=A0AAE0CF63_9CHLO|nr:hypothetical protein CYMTET_36813 [Cymbomonas tetramitiformis]